MKIIIDLQGLQREGNRRRGIGRYCLEFTKALINYYPENEYILFTNSALCDLRHDFFDELNNKKLNLVYFECPIVGDINQSYVGIYSKLRLSIQLRSYALSIINADIILVTSFFDGFRDNTTISYDSSRASTRTPSKSKITKISHFIASGIIHSTFNHFSKKNILSYHNFYLLQIFIVISI